MRTLLLLVLAAIAMVACADDTDDEQPRRVSARMGITLESCHPGVDEVLIHVIPIPENDVRRGGWFKTTNTALFLKDFSMLPSGLNRLETQAICRGLTGEVRSIVIDLQRPPPPVKVASVRAPANTNSPVPVRFAARPPQIQSPPLPPGMVMPLPDAETNRMSYKDSQLMKAYYSRDRRGK
jgi:hypothetical protein